MIRRLCLLAGVAMLFCLPARAQFLGDKIDLSAGYSYMRFRSTPEANMSGFDFTGRYRLLSFLAPVAEFGKEWGTISGVGSSVTTALFGAEAFWPRRISPFIHAEVGHAAFNGGGFYAGTLTLDGGFGVDIAWKHGFSWRPLQADYVRTRFRGETQANIRASAGIVFRF